MIETDEQRRWWFATHPEFSWSRRGARNRAQISKGFGLPAADRSTYDKYEDALDLIDKAEHELHREMGKRDGLGSDPHTFLDIVPYRRLITAPIATIKALMKKQATGYVLHVKAPDVPGQWMEVQRPYLGLPHQSKMSGQPMIFKEGKWYIKEYARYGTFFDNFKRGRLYEYKGPQGHLMRKNGLFYEFYYPQTLQDADRQLRSARGIPLIWRVGADQVDAFRHILKMRRDTMIIP
jgi:hypothetical protein